MLKHEARSRFLQKRSLLNAEGQTKINSSISLRLQGLINDKIQLVHVYLPITSKQEIDTCPFIRSLWKMNKQVVVPGIDDQQDRLISYKLTDTTQLTKGKWGVMEPADRITTDDRAIDLVIIPLVAFDLKGYRVGYGKGYYDRFLKTLDNKVLKIGVSHFPPIDNISNIDPWDIALDYCITPEKIIKF